MFHGAGTQVFAGTALIVAAGVGGGLLWFGMISGKKPRTMTQGWNKATAKYRAAMNNDPITGQ